MCWNAPTGFHISISNSYHALHFHALSLAQVRVHLKEKHALPRESHILWQSLQWVYEKHKTEVF